MSASLFIISAPSGAGKTSLVHALLQRVPTLAVSVSHTTRAQRATEQDGVDYNFVSVEAFERLIASQAFLEYAMVFGNYYGTTAAWVADKLSQGVDVLLEIDWQGAQQVKKNWPTAVSIFILPPSLEALKTRLQGRGQDHETVIAQRLAGARAEIRQYQQFDYLVINDAFETAVDDLVCILRSQQLRFGQQNSACRALLADLLTEKEKK